MGLKAREAFEQLEAVSTPSELRSLIEQLSVHAEGDVTILCLLTLVTIAWYRALSVD